MKLLEYKPRNLKAFIFTQEQEDGKTSVPNGLFRESWGWTLRTPEGHKNVNVGNYITVRELPDGTLEATGVEEAWRFLALYQGA